jgi:hypothetical protein
MPHTQSAFALAAAAAAGAVFSLAACSGSPAPAAWGGTVDTLATGVVLVSNPETGLWASGSGWRLVEELRIGSALDEGPAMIGNIAAIEVDEDGRVFVADRHASEVRIFDRDGRHVLSFGRKGGGPGEFEQIAGMGWGPDGHLWVRDMQNARFSVFDRSGAHLTDHRRQGGFVMLPWPGGFDAHGHVYDVGMAPDPGDGFRFAFVRHELRPASQGGDGGAEPGLKARDTMVIPRHEDGPRFTLRDAEGRTRIIASVPFAPGLVWRLANGYLWACITDTYRLHRIAFPGDTVRIVERPFTPAPVSAAEKDSAVAAMKWFTDPGGRVDRSRIPDHKPAVRDLFEDDAGYLWVWPNLAAGEPEALDVFDPDGRYLGRLTADAAIAPSPRPRVRDGRLYAVVRDDLDIQYVARFRIEGRAGRLAGE